MEVHAHTHSPRKKWQHYFWEFFMLFLAVTLGFFVENQREHLVEGRREKEFMISLVKDLKSDTLQLSRLKIYRQNRLHNIDSIFMFFLEHPGGSVPVYGYTLASRLFGHAAFFQNSGTLDQLKNSGGLRLIRQRNVVDSIESYDQQIKRMALRDVYETDFFVDMNKLSQNLFDSRDLLKIYVDTANYKKPNTPVKTIKLYTQYLNEFLNSIRTLQLTVNQNQDLQITIKDKATRLINLIQKEYHIDLK